MTTTDVVVTSSDGARRDRGWWTLVGAGAVVVLVVGMALLFGIGRPPPLTSLVDSSGPPPPGGVAWLSWVDGEDASCLSVARSDGDVDRVTCLRDGGEVAGWTTDGIVVRTWTGSREMLLVLDPADGAVLRRDALDERTSTRPTDERPFQDVVFDEREDTRLVVRVVEDPDVVVWRVEAPDRYRITSSARSVDGDWLALLDSAERLLVVEADGSGQPRVWAELDAQWTALVWEGTPVRP